LEQRALKVAAMYGRVQDAAWLIRRIQQQQQWKVDESKVTAPPSFDNFLHQQQILRLRFIEALFHNDDGNNDPGALLYMEQLVFSGFNADTREDNSFSASALQMLLLKWSKSRKPGAGKRAEAVLIRMKETTNFNAVSAAYKAVIIAYLHEESRTLDQVQDADRFLRQYLAHIDDGERLGVQSHEEAMLDNYLPHDWNVFDRVLEAYASCYVQNDTQASNAADELFRFFLLQHRDGKLLCCEEPGPNHLSHVLRQWNGKKRPTFADACKSLEYFRLLESLARRGVISAPPSIYNARQVLGTLARSKAKGFGADAEQLLQHVLLGAESHHRSSNHHDAPETKVLGHMFWCVVKCYCNEKSKSGTRSALAVIDQMETRQQLFAQKNPMAAQFFVRASRQTVSFSENVEFHHNGK